MSTTAEVVGKIDQINKRLTAQEELWKSLQKTASKTGETPSSIIHKSMGAGNHPGILVADGRGNLRMAGPASWYKPEGNRIGRRVNPDNGHEVSFGSYLKDMHDQCNRKSTPEIVKRLSLAGQQVFREDGDGRIIKTALAESSGVSGGYAVPPMFSEQLQMLEVENNVLEPRCHKQPLTSRTLLIPSLDQVTTSKAGQSNLLGGIYASWESEATTFPESEFKLRQTELTAWQLCFYFLASINLLNDEAVGLDALITQLFGKAIPWYKEYAFLQGTGVGQPMGILNCAALVQVQRQSTGKFQFSDIGQMVSKLYHMLDSNDIIWLVHPSVLAQLFVMTDPAGRPAYIPLDQGVQASSIPLNGKQAAGKLNGWPVYITEKLPALGSTGDVMLVDASKYIVAQRMELEIDASPIPYFLNYQMVWRVIWRGDAQPWLQGSITLADGSYTVSPFIALK